MTSPTTVSAAVADAYTSSASAWQRGPGRVYYLGDAPVLERSALERSAILLTGRVP